MLNQVVVWIETVPYSVLSGIDISTAEALIIYLIITGILVFILVETRQGLYGSLVLSIVFMVFQVVEVHQQKQQQFVTVYNIKGETAVALVDGTTVTFLASKNLWLNEQKMLFHVRHHWWNKGIATENFVELNDSIMNRPLNWNGIAIAVFDLKATGNLTLADSDFADLGIIHSCKWKNTQAVGNLQANQLVCSNNFGPVTIKRLLEEIPDIQQLSTGAVTYNLNDF